MPAQHILRTLLNDTCSLMHQARRQALEVTVMAALSGARLTVTALGRAIASRAKQKHCIKRADRLLSNPHVHRERSAIYAELVRRLIGGLSAGANVPSSWWIGQTWMTASAIFYCGRPEL